MIEGDPEVARAAIFEIIENQIEADTPPETRQTLERLIDEGHTEEEAMKLIGCVVAAEIFAVMKEGRTYNETAFVKALLALPKLPWE
jgi:peroxiredoxin family protein